MNIEQLENIVEIAKTSSLTEAAKNRNVTVPALSQSLAQLEKELGVILFKRSRSGSIPTPEGIVIIQNANEILHKLEELKENTQEMKNTISGEIRLATLPGPMPLIVDAITSLKQKYPNIRSYLFEENSREILGKILNHEVDIGLVGFYEEDIKNKKGLLFEKIVQGKIVIGVHKQSPLAKKRSIALDELKNYPLAIYNDVSMLKFMNKLKEKHGNFEVILTTNNLDSLRQVMNNELAVTVGVDFCFKTDTLYLENSNIINIDLELPDAKPVYLGIVRLKGKHYSALSKLMVKILQEEFIKLYDE